MAPSDGDLGGEMLVQHRVNGGDQGIAKIEHDPRPRNYKDQIVPQFFFVWRIHYAKTLPPGRGIVNHNSDLFQRGENTAQAPNDRS